MRYLRSLTLLLGLSLIFTVAGIMLFTPKTSALSGSDFHSGRIIDDGIFYEPSVMNINEIQAFLNSKVPTCDTNGSQAYGGTTRGAYGASRGYPPPYTCLKDYTENVPNKSPDSYCQGYPIGTGTKTAAQIIYDVSRACNINPKGLIVLLQKEQSLVTDDWPWSIQYRSATGYGCPDTAECDVAYYGFFNQVYNAARQFQRYRIQSHLFNYRTGVSSYVQYNPNGGCGGSNIYMQNAATAGLYNYTPYQPNGAALNNLYGTGDGCSAYGNRNFWRMWNDWFGSTITDYRWSSGGYRVLDKTESYYVDPGQLQPGEEYIVKLHATNIGSATWTNDGPTPVRLGTDRPGGRNSFLCDHSTGWLWCGRAVNMEQSSVSPGGLASFKFRIRAPYTPGLYREYFRPVAEMLTWFNDAGDSLGIRVVDPGSYQWESGGYRVLDQNESEYLDPGNLQPNTKYIVKLHAINKGSATWKNNGPTPVRLGTDHSGGHDSFLCDSPSWLWCGRPVNLQQSSVAPGQIGSFKFYIITPSSLGPHREYFKPVAEMTTWFNDGGIEEGLGIVIR